MDPIEKILSGLPHLNLERFIIDRQPHASGFGGTCDVYSAWSSKHKKKVAIKQIRHFLAKDNVFAKRLAKEIRIWAALENENILPLLGYIVEGQYKVPSLVSEWMEKGTLHESMKTFARGGIETCTMLFGIASGLAYLHSKGIVHADLKSQNVLISPHNTPLLADFGLSVVVIQTLTATTVPSMTAGGTVRWMAKELLLLPDGDPPTYNEQTDMWAFGMVTYELLSWNVPYSDIRGDLLVMTAITQGVLPVRPSEIDDTRISDGLWEVCQQCWSESQLRPSASKCMKSLSYIEARPGRDEDGIKTSQDDSGSDSIWRDLNRQGDIAISEVVYSYASTWSSNYTMSILPGPGRGIGIFISNTLAPRNITSKLKRLAGIIGFGKLSKAKRILKESKYWRLRELTEELRIDFCLKLLDFARLESRSIQILTFRAIVRGIVEFPPLRQELKACCRASGRIIELEVFSWKKTGTFYGPGWIYLHDMVRCCLNETPVTGMMAHLVQENNQRHFLYLSDIFNLSSGLSDASLALEFVTVSWDGFGLDTYLIRGGYHARAFAWLIISVYQRFEIADSDRQELGSWDESFDLLVSRIIVAVWRSLVPSGVEEYETIFGGQGQHAWSGIYAIYRASQSSIGEKLTPKSFRNHELPWKEQCRSKFSAPKYTALLEKLFELEDNDEGGFFRRFSRANKL